MKLKGRTAVVTGAGQGIGLAIAREFLSQGARVILAEADAEAGQRAQSRLKEAGEVLFVRTDVSREEDVRNLAGQVENAFGGTDILVNNAGIMIRKPLTELSLEEWNRVLGVNLTGAFLCARAFAPQLRQRKGAIVNIASTRALMSEADTESYSASKGGITALTHALAISLGPEVRVNCISPGWIDVSGWGKEGPEGQEELRPEDHRQHPAGRVGRPQDVAALALYLVAEESGFVTGSNFVVDGGMTRKMLYEE